MRKKTRSVFVGDVAIGGLKPVVVQSMTTTDTRQVKKTVNQIRRLQRAGCEIVRVAVRDTDAAAAIADIRKGIRIPLIADIHFDFRLALAAMRSGADGIRINPGNTTREGIRQVVAMARERGVAIRIGINAGSLEKDILRTHGHPCAEALSESALRHIGRMEEMGFDRIKVSVKSSHVPTMIEAYRTLSAATDYPLHLGVTEAGSLMSAAVKSAIGMGVLLYEGIGDTIRVSVTGDPVQELPVAYSILRTLGLRREGVEIIACPTCGRCDIDLAGLVRRVERRLAHTRPYLKVALMGCVVNGPGEAAEADVGLAGGRGFAMLFKKGKILRKVKENEMIDALMAEIDTLIREREES